MCKEGIVFYIMKYDLGMELLSKGYKLNELELYILNFIFSNCKIKNVERRSGFNSFNISSFDGINVDVDIASLANERSMKISFSNLQNDNEGIKSMFCLHSSGDRGKIQLEFKINGEHGYYIVYGMSDKYMSFKEDNKEDSKIKLCINYYDKEAMEYYKLRTGNDSFLDISDDKLQYYGIIPDSSSVVEYDDYHDLLNLFVNTLGSSGRFFEYIIDMIGIMESNKKVK